LFLIIPYSPQNKQTENKLSPFLLSKGQGQHLCRACLSFTVTLSAGKKGNDASCFFTQQLEKSEILQMFLPLQFSLLQLSLHLFWLMVFNELFH